MAQTNKQTAYGSVINAFSTELNSLGAGASVLASVGGAAGVYDNSTNLDIWVDAIASITYAVAPGASVNFEVYLLPSLDGGTTYADGSASVAAQPQLRLAFFELRAVNTLMNLVCRNCQIPPGKYKLLAVNNGSQALAGSGSTITFYPHDMQAV